MIGEAKLGSEDLSLGFKKLMMVAGGKNGEGVKMEGVVITKWKDIPMELLLRIVSLVDDRTVIVASGVCCGWRDAICLGLTQLCLSWCRKNMNNLDLDLSKSFKLGDRSLYALAHGCPNLTKLNISGCASFSDEALEYLTKFCRKLKILNICGCVKAATDRALQAIGQNCNMLQSLNLGWCDNVGDLGVMSLAYGCPDLRYLDLCGCVRITDDSVIALANKCLHLRSLDLYYCRNITDRAIYSLAHSRVKNKPSMWQSMKGGYDEEGLRSLNISQCTALTPSAVQALCDTFPALHTCSGRHSLVMSGCLNLTSVHCACAVNAHRTLNSVLHKAH
ncbi:F-box protein SKP2A-like isoform X2 [Durio zibethinus]|uniref:F-box protein SKP2A-like isoform X2 n=1 Tax=Durio zibethinus TaxID=66656 RepID=A0A6P5Z9V6_DURZI|nr:F-box protein SKP2A-like isoform X2 [Durio zibethinus]